MSDIQTQLRVLNVLDPSVCFGCRHANIAEVLFSDNSTRRMFYCSRLDCDNWVTSPPSAQDNAEEHHDVE